MAGDTELKDIILLCIIRQSIILEIDTNIFLREEMIFACLCRKGFDLLRVSEIWGYEYCKSNLQYHLPCPPCNGLNGCIWENKIFFFFSWEGREEYKGEVNYEW